MSTSITAPGKRETALQLLETGGMLVMLDARNDDVLVPFRYKHRNQLTLPVGPWHPDHTENVLHVSEAGLTGTLRFNRLTWPCHVPWSSVYALASMDGQGTFWRGEARDDPAYGKAVEVVPIHEDFQRYLVINGQAIVGNGSSILRIAEQELTGVRWIDWDGRRARMGGDLRELVRRFGVGSGSDIRRLRFSATMGYSAGAQISRVDWGDCRFTALSEDVAEFRSGSYYELHLGGCGLLPFLREWWFRLRAFFSRKESPGHVR